MNEKTFDITVSNKLAATEKHIIAINFKSKPTSAEVRDAVRNALLQVAEQWALCNLNCSFTINPSLLGDK